MPMAKQFSLLLLIVLYTCWQIEARESKFFSKYIQENGNKNDVTVVITTKDDLSVSSPTPLTSQISNVPTSAPAPAPAPTPLASENFYYEKTNLVGDQVEEEVLNDEELSRENRGFDSGSNGFWSSNYKGYESEAQGMRDTRFVENGKYYYNIESESYSPINKNVEGYYYGGYNLQKSRYDHEFNSMEEYEKLQEGYPDVQQYHFIP